jgi:hypothetical protein
MEPGTLRQVFAAFRHRGGKSYNEARKAGVARPFGQKDKIVITSYEFAALKDSEIARRLGFGGVRRSAPPAQRLYVSGGPGASAPGCGLPRRA